MRQLEPSLGGPDADRRALPRGQSSARWLAGLLLCSAALAAMFVMRVAPSFDAFRTKVVNRAVPASAETVGTEVRPFAPGGLTGPVAVIARIQNPSARGGRFAIAVDGQAICEREVAAGLRRVDCAIANWDSARTHRVEVRSVGGPVGAWALAYLEVASHHGATRNYDLIVVPSASTRHHKPGWLWIAAVFLGLACVPLVPARRLPRVGARLHRVVIAILVGFLSLVWLSPYVSPYLVVLSPRLFLAMLLPMYGPRLWTAVAWLVSGERQVPLRRVALVFLVGAVALGTYGAVAERLLSEAYGGNYSGFLKISGEMFDRNPMLNHRTDVRESLLLTPGGGYDGQFMYFAAFDPLLIKYRATPETYRLFIDAPPYRFGRIGFSWLAAVISGGNWRHFPSVMLWLIVCSLAGAAVSLGLLQTGAHPRILLGWLVVLIPGFWQSMQLGLPEPVAACLLMAGFLCVQRGRPRVAGVLFAMSLLVRETGGIFVLALAVAELLRRHRRDALWMMAISFVPYAAWRLYVGWVLAPDWGTQAFFLNVNNLGLPLVGLVELWRRVSSAAYYPADPAVSRAAVWYSALLVAGCSVAVLATVRRRSVAAVAAVLYGVLALSLTYDSIWIHVGNGQRGTFELFLMLALLTATTEDEAPALKCALWAFWLGAAGYVFLGGFDADFIRLTFV